MYNFMDYTQYQYSLRETMDPSITLCGMRDNDYQHRFSFRLTSYLLCYVVRGTAYLQNRCTQSPVEIRAGSLYILYPNDPLQSYYTLPDDGWTIYWVGVSGRFIRSFLASAGVRPEKPCLTLRSDPAIVGIYQKMLLLMRNQSYTRALQCQELLFRLLSIVHESAMQPDVCDYVEQALYIIRQNYSQSLSLARIADSIKINKSYLARLFRQRRGETVMDCLTAVRLNAAKNLLAKSAYSVAEIAELCGYQDAFYFSRVFKKKLGLSPSEFREENVGGTPEHWENVGDAAFLTGQCPAPLAAAGETQCGSLAQHIAAAQSPAPLELSRKAH